MSAAREAVARAVYTHAVGHIPNVTPWDRLPEDVRKSWYPRVDVTLAAIRPFIAAEIRAHREELDEENVCICGYHGDYPNHVASRICGDQ